jgi:hypothetical protein
MPHVLENLLADDDIADFAVFWDLFEIAVKGVSDFRSASCLLVNRHVITGLILSMIEKALVRAMAGASVKKQRSRLNFPRNYRHEFVDTVSGESFQWIINLRGNGIKQIR